MASSSLVSTRRRHARRNPPSPLAGLIASAGVGAVAGAALDTLPRQAGAGATTVVTYAVPAGMGLFWGIVRKDAIDGVAFALAAVSVAHAVEGARGTGSTALSWLTNLFRNVPYKQYADTFDLSQWGGAGFAFDQVHRRVLTINEGADAGPANTIPEAIHRVNVWTGKEPGP